MLYYSERLYGVKQRDQETMVNMWVIIRSLYENFRDRGYFAGNYPELGSIQTANGTYCKTIGTNKDALFSAIVRHVPSLDKHDFWFVHDGWAEQSDMPEVEIILDFIEFCYQEISAPPVTKKIETFNNYEGCDELIEVYDGEFSSLEGKEKFKEELETTFRRHGLMYRITDEGCIEKSLNGDLVNLMGACDTIEIEPETDRYLSTARDKIKSHKIADKQNALEAIWDAFERMKTLLNPGNKSKSITMLIEQAALEVRGMDEMLNKESTALTQVGNSYQIRHTEQNQIKLEEEIHIEYLYHRLSALVYLLGKAYVSESKKL